MFFRRSPSSVNVRPRLFLSDKPRPHRGLPYKLSPFGISWHCTGMGCSRYSNSDLSRPQVLQHMFNFVNVTLDWIDGVLKDTVVLMTNRIRENGNNAPANSTATDLATCVHIEWG